jgi:hypothetical protein
MNSVASNDGPAAVATKLWGLPAYELARLVAQRELSSVEVVRAHIDRIEAVNGWLNAVTCKRYEAALNEAVEVDNKIARGESMKPCLPARSSRGRSGIEHGRRERSGVAAPGDGAAIKIFYGLLPAMACAAYGR